MATKLIITATIEPADADLADRLATVIRNDHARNGVPDIAELNRAQSALVMFKQVSALMRDLADHITQRTTAAEQNGQPHPGDIQFALGAYQACEAIRDQIINPHTES